MSPPARAARLGGRRRFMPRKPFARCIAPFPQQTGYGRELREKELTKDDVDCAETLAATVRKEGFQASAMPEAWR